MMSSLPVALDPAADATTALAPRRDALGVFEVPTHERTRAQALAARWSGWAGALPQTRTGRLLSRGPRYYDVVNANQTVPDLAAVALRLLDDTRCPHTLMAVLEALHNDVCAAVYALWEASTDGERPQDGGQLAQLLSWARELAGCLDPGGSSHRPDDTHRLLDDLVRRWPDQQLWPRAMATRFRELDSLAKIWDEVDFLVAEILGRHDVDQVLCPLYGGLGLANTLASRLQVGRPQVVLVRIGFHDLGYVDFSSTGGDVRLDAVCPPHLRRDVARHLSAGTTLVVDDNVGHGRTLIACRQLVNQLGGRALTRAVETSWDLLVDHRDLDLSPVVDLPSLRPTFHHSLQSELIGLLRAGRVDDYCDHPARQPRVPLVIQLERRREQALRSASWSQDQQAHLGRELEWARNRWTESSVPERERP